MTHPLAPLGRALAARAVRYVLGPDEFQADLTLVMQGFEFEAVWDTRRVFLIDGVEIPTARLLHILSSKQKAARDKDKLFLASHRDALEQLLKSTKD